MKLHYQSNLKKYPNVSRLNWRKVPDIENGLELSFAVMYPRAYFYRRWKKILLIKWLVFGLCIKKTYSKKSCQQRSLLAKYPSQNQMAEMEACRPNAYFFSNGPVIQRMEYAVATQRIILTLQVNLFRYLSWSSNPFAEILRNNQLIRCTMDIGGLNHPIKNLESGTKWNTSQIHGFNINPEKMLRKSLEVEITHVHWMTTLVARIRL